MEVDLIAHEPAISQLLFLTWDSRGRLWVIQYRQYQYPAGLKVVRYDQYLRAVFDKVPEPPPLGALGLDRVVWQPETIRMNLDDLRAVNTSLMPEQLLRELTDEQIKDLMAYMSLGAAKTRVSEGAPVDGSDSSPEVTRQQDN